jgi:hypothetical protein
LAISFGINYVGNQDIVNKINEFWDNPRSTAVLAMRNGIFSDLPQKPVILTSINYPWSIAPFYNQYSNVVPDQLKEPTIVYKKVLGGLLFEIVDHVKHLYAKLDKVHTDATIDEVKTFASNYLGVQLSENFDVKSLSEKEDFLKNILNRPTRICGVVKNTGEPGGGPFWCKDANGNNTLQLVESAQVDASDVAQMAIFTGSTHFNPVDLVCSTKDVHGKEFDLLSFRDMSTGFITEKTKDGRKLKAQELPGLWNGAMAFWNTIFVEVPLETFNPVKSVNDLLRDSHQN